MAAFKKVLSSFWARDFNKEYFWVLDLGTIRRKAAVVQIGLDPETRKKQAVIIGAGKDRAQNKKREETTLDEMAASCQRALDEAENSAGISPRHMILGVSGQMMKVMTSSEIYQRRNPAKPITLIEIKNIIQKIQWRILDKIRAKEREECDTPEKNIKISSGEILEIRIDGYQVINPVGFRGKEISFVILNTYSSLLYFKLLRRLASSLKVKLRAIAVDGHAVLNAITEKVFKAGNLGGVSCFLIDCGGKMTDVFAVCEGFMEGPKTLSLGGDSFTKKLAAKIGLSREEAESLKIEYSLGKLPKAIKQRIDDILAPDLKIWFKGTDAILNDFFFAGSAPILILSFGGSAVLPDIKKFLEGKDWQARIDLRQGAKMKTIEGKDISSVEDGTGLLDKPEDIPILALAKNGLELMKKKSEMNKILGKVIRLMQ